MGHRRYFIRKDVKKAGKVKEWIEMEGDEFYRFLRTEDAKGRYFIQLANDGDPDCDVIHMEVSKPEYLAWRADYDRKQYYRKRNLRHAGRFCRYNSPLELKTCKCTTGCSRCDPLWHSPRVAEPITRPSSSTIGNRSSLLSFFIYS